MEQILSERELEILKLISRGFTTKEIGEKLFISPRTVETHRRNIKSKLNVGSIIEMVRYYNVNFLGDENIEDDDLKALVNKAQELVIIVEKIKDKYWKLKG